MCSCPCFGGAVSWLARELRPGRGVAAERLTLRDSRTSVEGRALVAGGVGVERQVAVLGVELVELLGVAPLSGLAVGVALVVDRGAVGLRVQELLSAEHGQRWRVAARGAVHRRVGALLAD